MATTSEKQCQKMVEMAIFDEIFVELEETRRKLRDALQEVEDLTIENDWLHCMLISTQNFELPVGSKQTPPETEAAKIQNEKKAKTEYEEKSTRRLRPRKRKIEF